MWISDKQKILINAELHTHTQRKTVGDLLLGLFCIRYLTEKA